MDSLTQIVLGAAVGEVVMGRKLGNRAMVWGAVSGTIPDLDILAYLFMDDIEALAVHRGLSHSIFFALLFPWFIGWITNEIYKSPIYQKRWFRWVGLAIGITIFTLIGTIVNIIVGSLSGGVNYPVVFMTIVLGGLFFYRVYHRQKSGVVDSNQIQYLDWVKLHFWAIFTHPLLDSCTTYGTQLFQPFWDYRVALNNISVVDPLYTVPFLLLLIVASQVPKGKPPRRILNGAGIVISTLYLVWTINNKFKVNKIFEDNLSQQKIPYERYMTSPTIMNNILWYCVADGESHYYRAFYSLLDSSQNMTIDSIRKQHYLLDQYEGQRPIEILQWFSNDYYVVRPILNGQDDGHLKYYDVRFGAPGMGNSKNEGAEEFVFGFSIDTSASEVEVHELRERPEDGGAAFKILMDRIIGD